MPKDSLERDRVEACTAPITPRPNLSALDHFLSSLERISTVAPRPKNRNVLVRNRRALSGSEGYLSPELYMLAVKPSSGALFCLLIIGTVKLGCAHQSAALVANVDAVVWHGTDPII
jgi:hypothetical protein